MATQNVESNGASTPSNAFFTGGDPMVMDADTLKSLSDPEPKEGESAQKVADESGETPPKEVDPEAGEVEKEALAAGWVDKAAWVARRGSDKGWRPAEQYMEVRSHVLPLVSKENRELREEVRQLRLEREAEKAARAELEVARAKFQLQTEWQEAQEAGDWNRAGEIMRKMVDTTVAEKTAPVARPAAANAPNPEVQRVFVDFAKANPWVNTDAEMAEELAIHLSKLIELNPKRDPAEALQRAKAKVVRENPDRFPGRRSAMAESGGEHGNAGSGGKHTWNDLRPEHRAFYDDKYFRANPKITKAALLSQFDPSYFRN